MRVKFFLISAGLIIVLFACYTFFQIRIFDDVSERDIDEQVVIEQWYAPLYPMAIGPTIVQASIADTVKTRTKGLSGTPYLPEEVVKLFVFETSEYWDFWMKDMSYSIDIIWIDERGIVVHIEEMVSPNSFPNKITPSTAALYVVEAKAGFVDKYEIEIGQTVTLPVIRNE